MANTFTQLTIHAVFSVKGRGCFLQKSFRSELFQYISGILKNINQYPLAVNGYKDHVHIVFEMNPTQSLSEVMEKVKSNSSRWINDNKLLPGKFEWQRGYSGFSYARSQRDNVINYVLKQEEHHSKKSFKDEYFELMSEFGITFDPKYIFEFYDEE